MVSKFFNTSSTFIGAVTLERTGRNNSCYGGNTFSTEVRFTSSSSFDLEVAEAVNNVVVKSN